MTTEKSAKEWFEMLKEPYRSQAIKASEEQRFYIRKKPTYKSLIEALDCEFNKLLSEQRHEYWDVIYFSIQSGETTYLAEPPTE